MAIAFTEATGDTGDDASLADFRWWVATTCDMGEDEGFDEGLCEILLEAKVALVGDVYDEKTCDEVLDIGFDKLSANNILSINGLVKLFRPVEPYYELQEITSIMRAYGSPENETGVFFMNRKQFYKWMVTYRNNTPLSLDELKACLQRAFIHKINTEELPDIIMERWTCWRSVYYFIDESDAGCIQYPDFKDLVTTLRVFGKVLFGKDRDDHTRQDIENEFKEATLGRDLMYPSDFYLWTYNVFRDKDEEIFTEALQKAVMVAKKRSFNIKSDEQLACIDKVFDAHLSEALGDRIPMGPGLLVTLQGIDPDRFTKKAVMDILEKKNKDKLSKDEKLQCSLDRKQFFDVVSKAMGKKAFGDGMAKAWAVDACAVAR